MFETTKRLNGNSMLIIHIRVLNLDTKVINRLLLKFKNEVDLLEYNGYTSQKLRNDFYQIKYKLKKYYKDGISFAFVYDKWRKKIKFYSLKKNYEVR